jgi:hypothetical protein
VTAGWELGDEGLPAVVAVNDLTAVGLIKGFTQAGLRVPEDISVTGFDNTHLAEYITPSITTGDGRSFPKSLSQRKAEQIETLQALGNQLEPRADFRLRLFRAVLGQKVSSGSEVRVGGCQRLFCDGRAGRCLGVYQTQRKR